MASRTARIVLAGEWYTIHPFTIGELEEVSDLLSNGTSPLRMTIDVLCIALRRAEPKLEDFRSVEGCTVKEINEASNEVLKLAGIEVTTPNPPQAVTPAA